MSLSPTIMQALHLAISEASAAVRKVATPEHVGAIEAKLLSSMEEFPLDANHDFANIAMGPGVYLFEIKFPFKTKAEFTQFVKNWGSKGTTGLQKGTSRSYPKRAMHHVAKVIAGEFIPFYVGKNMNVRSRVAQHLTGKAETGTYGLKLLSRGTVLNGCTLRASGVVFEIDSEAYFCVQFLEAALRERLHPIVGRQ